MTSTKNVAPESLPPATDGFDSLREEFLKRLGQARILFTTSSAELARAGENAAPIFHDLYVRAHRLRGGAAIFEFADIEAAAGALEEAAAAATRVQADNTDAGVWTALAALVKVMGTLDDRRSACNAEKPASACGTNDPGVNPRLSEIATVEVRMP